MNILNIILIILGFSFIIAIHELGHFLAARRAGITCPVFSVGFPLPASLFRLLHLPERFRNILAVKWKGTEWRLGWIPIGGFVQMKGQSDTPDGLDDNAGSTDDFRNVSYPNKVLVISGGVIMNAITGIVFFILAFAVFGVTFVDPVVGNVVEADTSTGKPTDTFIKNEIQPGDRVLSIITKDGETPVNDFEDIIYEGFFADGAVKMRIRHPDGKEAVVDVSTNHVHEKIDAAIPPLMSQTRLHVSEEEAEHSGGKLRAGDLLVAINGRPVNTAQDISTILSDVRGGSTVTITSEDPDTGKHTDAEYTPRARAHGMYSDLGMHIEEAAVVNAVREKTPGAEGALKAGDQVLRARWAGAPARLAGPDGWVPVTGIGQLRQFIAHSDGVPMELEVARLGDAATTVGGDAGDGKTLVVKVTPRKANEKALYPTIGVMFRGSDKPVANAKLSKAASGGALVVGDVVPGSTADQAGIKPGDEITDVPSVPETLKTGGVLGMFKSEKTLTVRERLLIALTKYDIVAAAAKTAPSDVKLDPLELKVKRGDKTETISLSPTLTGPDSQPMLAVEARIVRTPPQTFGLGESVVQGFDHSHKKVVQILETLRGLFTGHVSITNLAGPVMIAKASYDVSQYGFGTLLFFLGFISINLAIVNFLPIPVLDGGLFWIATIERIKGSPINERFMGWVNTAAFLAVIGLMLFVVFNDIRTLVSI
jgi:regulator of sigma E protease